MFDGLVATRRFVFGSLVTMICAAPAAMAQSPLLASSLVSSPVVSSPFVSNAGVSSVITSHVPSIVQSGRAKLVGAMAPAQTLRLALNLPIRNEAALDSLLAELYNPKSPKFHKWLSQPEFEAQFGPTEADKQTMIQWAKDKGFDIKYTAPNGRIIEVDAPVSAVNKAFHVTVQTYHDTLLNRDFHAPDKEPTTDMKIALLSVDGLEDSEPKVKHVQKDPKLSLPGTVTAPTLDTAGAMITSPKGITWQPAKPQVNGSGPDNSYLPSDMRAAYYGTGNLTGQGQTVGIFSFDGYLAADLPLYYSSTGFSSTVPVTNVLTGTFNGACTAPCADDEQILDIVQVQGMAPGLTSIRFYENGTTANTELNVMVTDNLAKTISSSWGGGGFAASSDTYFKQMATQGQSYLSATGDDGAFYKGNYSAPSLDAYITQVGGTDLTTTGPGGSYVSEYAWDGSSGGYWITGMTTASKILIPTWQTAAVNSSNGASSTYRNVPDIGAEANYDNGTVSNGVYELGYGGTSYATPRYAGYIALANQQSLENGGTTMGFLNPALYAAGESASTATIYNDVVGGTDPAYPAGTPTYTAVAGYDIVTGWGSPNGAGLINYLAGAPAADFGLAPSSVSVQNGGPAVMVQIPLSVYNSFAGTVSLAVTGLPTGVTASVTSGTPTAPPTVTLTASGATMATYNATLTGTSGTLSHAITLPVTVEKRTNDDFSLTSTAVSVDQNNTSGSTITINVGSGLVGYITLTASGYAPGLSGAFSVTQTPIDTPSSTSVLSISAAGSLPAGTYVVTVTGTSVAGISHSVTVPITVTTPASLLADGGFESGGGTGAAWTVSGVGYLDQSSGIPPHTGTYFVVLDGGSAAETSTVTQSVSIPAGKSVATLGVWYWVLSGQTGTTAVDTMAIQITNSSGTVQTLGNVSNLTQNGYWAYVSYDVSSYIGQTVTVGFLGKQAGTTYTDFLLDDVTLVVK